MTMNETRSLGIEFERRVQTAIPGTEFANKLDTDTIYSFLNQYQNKYVKEIYLSLDNVDQSKNISRRLESILQHLIRTETIDATVENTIAVGSGSSVRYELSRSIGRYIDSYSTVSSSYKMKSEDDNSGILHNLIMQYPTFIKFMQSPYDSMKILRNPIAAIEGGESLKSTLNVIYDRYTTPTSISISYYIQPSEFNILTSTLCELPIDAFDDLVTGAVDLYIQYAAGAEAMRRKQIELALQQQNNKNNDNDKEQ